MEKVITGCHYFLSKYCCEEFLVNFNFLNVECLKAAVSKALGFAIIAGSVLVKVPQILKIFGAKSAEGISLAGTVLELFALLSGVAYSFTNKYPFSSYGDAVFLLIQTSLIGSMVLYYGGSKSKASLFLLSVIAAFTTLISSTPLTLLWFLQASNIPLIFSAKIIQAWTNYQNSSTGQLSAITIILLFLGSSARIFTSVQETGDPVIIMTYCAATSANAVLFGQLLYYWEASKTEPSILKLKKTV